MYRTPSVLIWVRIADLSGDDRSVLSLPRLPAIAGLSAEAGGTSRAIVRHLMLTYSITSSARASNVGGMSRPSALAVLPARPPRQLTLQ